MDVKNKICTLCLVKKPVSEFYSYFRTARNKTILTSRCKECFKKKVLDYVKTPIGRIKHRKWARNWAKTENGKKFYHARTVKRRKIDREKCLCRQRFNGYIYRGTIKRQPCSICKKENAHAHHENYNKPLEVIWLCRTHHLMHHNQIYA